MIRAMESKDVLGVSSLLCECYRWLADKDGYDDRQLTDMIERRGSVLSLRKQANMYDCHVCIQNSEIVGIVAINGNELAKLFVRIADHRKGIGKLLFQFAEELIGRKYSGMHLGAFQSAISFYEKMGMHISEWKEIDRGPLKGMRQSIMKKELHSHVYGRSTSHR